jgi:hypothetical protein
MGLSVCATDKDGSTTVDTHSNVNSAGLAITTSSGADDTSSFLDLTRFAARKDC